MKGIKRPLEIQIQEALSGEGFEEHDASGFIEDYRRRISSPEFQKEMMEIDAERQRTWSLLNQQIVGNEDPTIFL